MLPKNSSALLPEIDFSGLSGITVSGLDKRAEGCQRLRFVAS
jgi:hypothetical protein